MTDFSNLGLVEPIRAALTAKGYTTPTPIQARAIPVVIGGRDLLGIAATGTGKTAAFALPILQRLAAASQRTKRNGCRALVLAPTRELAGQIGDSFRAYGANLGLTVAVIVGGVSIRPQTATLSRGVDVLVATPGRLIDHMDQGNLRLDGVEVLVLDEADHMLDLGFIPSVRRIVARIPRSRQSLFFSATMPPEIRKLADEMLRDPETVSVVPSATPAERIEQRVIHVERAGKGRLLADIVGGHEDGRVLVFTRTKRGADRVVRGLGQSTIDAAAIHGNKSQVQRERALAGFRAGRTPVLVATDIAARGIDVDGITLVVNFDLPEVPETYVHRIGRTARAGAAGNAVSFCDSEERKYLRAIESLIRQRIPADGASGAVAERPAGRQQPVSLPGAANGNGSGPSRDAPSARSRSRRGRRRPAAAAQVAAV